MTGASAFGPSGAARGDCLTSPSSPEQTEPGDTGRGPPPCQGGGRGKAWRPHPRRHGCRRPRPRRAGPGTPPVEPRGGGEAGHDSWFFARSSAGTGALPVADAARGGRCQRGPAAGEAGGGGGRRSAPLRTPSRWWGWGAPRRHVAHPAPIGKAETIEQSRAPARHSARGGRLSAAAILLEAAERGRRQGQGRARARALLPLP